MSSQNVVIAMTGASGSIYAIRLITALLSANRSVHLVVSGAARQVMLRELEVEFPASGAGEAAWRQFLTGLPNCGDSQLRRRPRISSIKRKAEVCECMGSLIIPRGSPADHS